MKIRLYNFALIVLLSLSFLIQIEQVTSLPNEIVHPDADAWWYVDVATSLVKGCGYTLGCEEPTALRDPLYPVILAGTYLLGGQTLFWIRLLQVLANVISTVFIYDISRIIWNRVAGLVAAVLFALDPVVIYYSSRILSETLANFFVLFTIWLLVARAIRENSRSQSNYFLLVGCLAGLLVLQKAAMVIIPAAILLALLWAFGKHVQDKGKGITQSLLLIPLGVGLVLAPWLLRNVLLFQKPILASTSGYAIVANNNLPWPKFPNDASETERDQLWWYEGRSYIRNYPLTFAKKMVRNLELLLQKPIIAGGRIGSQTLLGKSSEMTFASLNFIFSFRHIFLGIGMSLLLWKDNAERKMVLVTFTSLMILFAVFGTTAFWRFHLLVFPWFAIIAGTGFAGVTEELLRVVRGGLPKGWLRARKNGIVFLLFIMFVGFQRAQFTPWLGSRYQTPDRRFELILDESFVENQNSLELQESWDDFCHDGKAVISFEREGVAIRPQSNNYNCRFIGPKLEIQPGAAVQLVVELMEQGQVSSGVQLQVFDVDEQLVGTVTADSVEQEVGSSLLLVRNYTLPANASYVVPGVMVWQFRDSIEPGEVVIKNVKFLAHQ